MAWSVKTGSKFKKTVKCQLLKLDRQWQSSILNYLEDEVAPLADPRTRGKPLVGDKRGLWRYRVGNYRIIFDVQDENLMVLVLTTGHRRDIYSE